MGHSEMHNFNPKEKRKPLSVLAGINTIILSENCTAVQSAHLIFC